MQCGFAMLEVGSCREAHRMTVLAKNVLDSAASMCGFLLYCELTSPILVTDADERIQPHLFVFHWAFCAATVTICSGSMAERTHMVAYMSYALAMSFFIYPQVAIGAWGNSGILSGHFHSKYHSDYNYHDFAGSGVVHLCGGCAAFIGNMFLGRRILQPESTPSSSPMVSGMQTPVGGHGPQRRSEIDSPPTSEKAASLDGQSVSSSKTSTENTWPRRFDDLHRDEKEFTPSNYLQVMGMFMLWVGWYGFNVGSTLSFDAAGSTAAGIVAMNTTLAACSGGLGSYMYCYYLGQIDLSHICNGVLCGLVAITACCDVATKPLSLFIGFASSVVVYPVCQAIMKGLRIDDPVDAIPVHAGSGLFGVLVVSFCRPDCDFLKQISGGGMAEQIKYCSEEHQMGKQFIAQAWGAFTLLWWTMLCSFILWGAFVLSECTLAREDELIAEIRKQLSQMALVDPIPEISPELRKKIGRSGIVSQILQQNGWIDGKIPAAERQTPSSLLRLCSLLQRAREEKAKSALEIKDQIIFKTLSQFLHDMCFPCVPTIVRLRILPSAELSGLAATEIDGIKIMRKIGRLIASLSKETTSANQASNEALKREVEDLNSVVQTQDMLLEQLRQQAAQYPQDLQHVEDGYLSPVSSGSSKVWFDAPLATVYKVEQQLRSHKALRPGSSAGSGDSRASNGQMSPNSELTPPSSTMMSSLPSFSSQQRLIPGSTSKSRGRNSSASSGQDAMGEVALRLLAIVQNQQQLMVNMQRSSPSSEAPPQSREQGLDSQV
jgi:ammonia channel protein AmtB